MPRLPRALIALSSLALLSLGGPAAAAEGGGPAAELDLRYLAFPDGSAGRLVYLDILGTPVPPIELEDGKGGTYKLNLKVRYEEGSEELVIQPFLYRIERDRRGEHLVELGDTEVRTTPGAKASVRFGTDGKTPPKEGFELDFRPSFDRAPRLPEPPAPPAAPAEAPAEEAPPAAPPPDDDEFIKKPGE